MTATDEQNPHIPNARVTPGDVHCLSVFSTTHIVSRCLWLLTFELLWLPVSRAQQQPVNQSGVDAPAAQESNTVTSRFVGYATSKSLIFPDIATSPGPLSAMSKFKLFVNQSISPPYVMAAALTAAFNQARDVPQRYGQGWNAYAGRFGADMARATSDSFFGTFLFASVLHQDPRFFPESEPRMWRTVKYSAALIVFTRNDSGETVFNSSGLLGPLSSEGLANVYLPGSEQSVSGTLTRFGTDLAWQFAGNMFKNYWPTLFRDMGLNRLKVVPDPGVPIPPKQEK